MPPLLITERVGRDAARWALAAIGPLPATVLVLPLLFAAGTGVVFALAAALGEPSGSAAGRWTAVTTSARWLAWIAAADAGVLALWVLALAESPAALRRSRSRWWLVAGLVLGLLAAGRWLVVMGTSAHSYGPSTWAVWLALLAGPLVLGTYYLVRLLR